LDDAKIIARSFPETILAVSPLVTGHAQIRLGGTDSTTSILGTNTSFIVVNNASIRYGRMFNAFEDSGTQKVCVAGAVVAEKLLGGRNKDLTGITIKVNRQSFLVIGMMTPKGASAFGQDQDDVLVMPVQTAMRRVLNTTRIQMLAVRCSTAAAMPLAQQQISSLLRSRHHDRPPYPDNDDFSVMSQTELMERQQSVTSTMSTLLNAVAVISLVVGGIGIMNIMLVSVTERTREIGIRLAVGARGRDVLMQFLTEAVLLSVLGGALGIATGYWLAPLLTRLFEFPTLISQTSVILAFSVSAVIGIVFGFFPALKAANLDPIDALRYE
jgi:putative ABC transport system permease protein